MKAVIFDMDGVIVDSEPLHVKAEKEVCRRYNIQVEDNDWLGFKGKTTIDIFSFISKNTIPLLIQSKWLMLSLEFILSLRQNRKT